MRVEALQRHDLVRVDPAAWARHLADRPDLARLPHLPAWAGEGRPLIVRRYGPGEARDLVPLGLPLPPAEGKRRIGFAFAAADLEPRPAPTLADVAHTVPTAWAATLERLIASGSRHGTPPRPFGALLWQALTGLAYLTPASDLDLLWPIADALPTSLLDDLAHIAGTAPTPIDGELILPDGAGIQWRELAHAMSASAPVDATVLAKHRDRLEMRSVAGLRGGIAA